jgi:hypothetical protein
LLIQIVNDEVRYVHWRGRHIWTGRSARDAMRVLRTFFPDDFANDKLTGGYREGEHNEKR